MGLRHTSATLALASGVPSKVVQQRLGHSTIGTTLDLYAHPLESQHQDAASRIGATLTAERVSREVGAHGGAPASRLSSGLL